MGTPEAPRVAQAGAPGPPPAGRPLSVLYVVHGFPPDTWAGTEVYTLGLAREMRRLGQRVTVLARAPADRPLERGGSPDWTLVEGSFDGIPVWRVVRRVEGPRPIGESYKAPEAAELFRGVLARLRPDVVHFQHLLHLSADLPRVARGLGVPSVITCNDYWALCARVQMIRPDGVRCERNQGMGCHVCLQGGIGLARIPLARRWYPLAHPLMRALGLAARVRIPIDEAQRRLTRRRARWARRAQSWFDLRERQERVLAGFAAADLLIAPSRFLRGKLLETGRFDEARVVHSDYGMRRFDAATFERPRDPGGRVRFGFVGSLVWYKGADVLVEAMNRLAGRPCVLHVFGAFDPARDEHHAKLRGLASAGNVVFRGRFDNERLAEVYREIDVLVVPSVWFENSPLSIHEAWTFRTPVVASGIGGMAELVDDGVDGLHFAAGDAADLASKLARFLDEPDLVGRLSRGFPRVKSLEEDAADLLRRYRQLAERGPRA